MLYFLHNEYTEPLQSLLLVLALSGWLTARTLCLGYYKNTALCLDS